MKSIWKLTTDFTICSVHYQNKMNNTIEQQSGTFLLFLQDNQVKCTCTDEKIFFNCFRNAFKFNT